MVQFRILRRFICLVVLAVLPSVAAAEGPAPEDRVLRVGPTSKPPVIDGDLGDACWRDATLASGFITILGAWIAQQTTAYVTYDDTFLYIAYRCSEDEIDRLDAHTTGHDDVRIFTNDDSVEFFLDTNLDRASYYHFGVNSAGWRYDGAVEISGTKDTRDDDWNPDWEVKTAIGKDHWTLEARIPFSSLGVAGPEPGSKWGINLNRSRRVGSKDGVYSSWAAVTQGFNRPDAFGTMIFGAPSALSYSILSLGDPQSGSTLRVNLRNGTDARLIARTQWTVSPSWTEGSIEAAATPLDPKSEKEVSIPYEVPSRHLNDVPLGPMGTLEFALKVDNATTGETHDLKEGSFVWGKGGIMDLSLDRYYYTPDVQQLQAILTREIKEGAFLHLELRNRLDGPALLSTEIVLEPDQDEYAASFDIGDLDFGRYIMAAHLLDPAGGRLYSIHRVFIRKRIAPAKDPPHTLDTRIRSDGILLRDGKPFCPFIGIGNVSSPLGQDCFNVKSGRAGLVENPLDRPKLGLPWITTEEGRYFILMPEEERMLRGIRGNVEGRQSDPSILCWLMKHEARIPMFRGEKRVRLNNLEEFAKIRRFVKGLDPNRLTSIQIDHSHSLKSYADAADIIEVAYKSSSFAKRIIPKLTQDLKEIRSVIGPGKPFFFWIGSSIPHPEDRSAEDIRGATYLALLYGATGIVFHMGHKGVPLEDTRHWSVYPGLSREVEEVFSILTTPQSDPAPGITVSPDVIETRVRRVGDRVYLVAVNKADYLVAATISIKDFSLISKHVNLPLEYRKIKMEKGRFKDAFTAYEPHMYEIRQ
jgi:hypothetical protein